MYNWRFCLSPLCPTPFTFKLGNTDGSLGLDNKKCALVKIKSYDDYSGCTHFLVIIHPIVIRTLELDLSERRSALDSHALPDSLEDKGVNFWRPWK